MKFTFLGYSQEKLIENGIDLKEASILRLVADLHKGLVNKKKYSVFNNEIYVWFTYGYLARQFPIAGSEKTIMRKINELVEKGFLKKIIKTNRNGMAGTYMYIAVSKNMKSLTLSVKKIIRIFTICPIILSKLSDKFSYGVNLFGKRYN